MNTELKLDYKKEKLLKKHCGKLLGIEIAFGRNLIKIIKENYQPERLNPEDHFADAEKMVCDSPIPDYKENQGITQK